MGLFGRKRDQQEQASEALERLTHRAQDATGGHLGATAGFGALKDVMALANEARAESGPMRAYAARIQLLANQGVDATATVRSVQPTTIAALMGGEQMHVELTVQPPNGTAYDAATDQLLMPGQSEHLTVGSEVHVKVDPNDPQSVMLMLAGSGVGPSVFQSTGPGGVTVISSGGTTMFGSVRFEAPAGTGPETRQASASAASASTAGNAPLDPVSQLESLAQLHSSGELTDEEFADAKRRLLNS